MAGLEQAARTAHRQLSVWLTLPAEPSGLRGNAIAVITAMLRDHVSVAGVDIAAMDFTQPPAAGTTMLALVENALRTTQAQLTRLFPRYGVRLSSQQLWQRLGGTVMIGQNDIPGEQFTAAEASGLVSFAAVNHLGRISAWSLNRDSQCGSSFAEVGLLSNTCSGTAQSHLQFTRIFGRLDGAASTSAGDARPAGANTRPADAPYPLWSAAAGYPSGVMVVEDGEIYQAKWYNTGQDPQAQVQYSWQTPWDLVGPVPPGEHAPVPVKSPAASEQPWSKGSQYQAGRKVLYAGQTYQARWSNQGVSPQTQSIDPSASPWQVVYQAPR